MKLSIAQSVLLALSSSVSADFLTPENATGTKWRKGELITIRWNSTWSQWNNGPAPGANYDLWITTYYGDAYISNLHAFGDIQGGGEWDWYVDAPDEFADGVRQLLFRFQEHSDSGSYDTTAWQYPSWPFAIVRASETSSAGTVSATLATSPSASVLDGTSTIKPPEASNTSESPVPGSSSNENEESSSGPSSGVIAGAVVGGLAGAAAIVGGVLLLLRRKKRRDKKTPVFEIDGDVTETPGMTATDLAIAAQKTNAKYKRSDLPELVTAR